MQSTTRGETQRLLLIFAASALICAISALFGYRGLDARWSEIAQLSLTTESGGTNVFWAVRAPRVALGALAGAGLALGGFVLQTLFRNPLATADTLGISAAAALAAALALTLGVRGQFAGTPSLALFAFCGAMTAIAVVYALSRLTGERDMTFLLLAGVCVSYVSSAGILLTQYLAERAITNDIVIWMMGSLGVLRPRAGVEIALILVPATLYSAYCSRALDLLAHGDDLAATRGVAVQRTIWSLLAMMGMLLAVIVANCGPIGFVGLIVPSLARSVLVGRSLPAMLASVALGAAFLVACDAAARTISAYEPPVGILTSIIGALFFFTLLARRGRTSS